MIFVSLILFLYGMLVVVLLIGFRKAFCKPLPSSSANEHSISVVLAVRNEEKVIEQLLEEILRQNYNNFQVIVVDDHSTDNTPMLLKKSGMSRLSVYENPGEGKKSAIAHGVVKAEGEIIVTTDADCRHPAGWLQTINDYFQHDALLFLFGGVKFRDSDSFFSKIQSLEFASLIASGAAAAGLKMPVMCNGANLAYRKYVFEAVGGYEGNLHVASGDDEFLMRKIHQKYPGSVQFANSEKMIVETSSAPDIRSFFQQRIRWASKWRHNSSWHAVMLAFFILMVQVATILAVAFMFAVVHPVLVVALVWKIATEWLFLSYASHFLHFRWNWLAFILLQVIYPFYVVTVGVVSSFLTYSWKGRKIR